MDDAGDLIGGFDRRLTRQEEWGRLTDGRTTRLEDKIDRLIVEMADFRADIRANVATKADLASERRRIEGQFWTAVGVIVGAMALVATLFQTLQVQGSHPAAAPATAPIVIQLPAPAAAARTADRPLVR